NYDVPVLASHLYSLHISFIRTACSSSCTFCFTATTPTKIYTLSLHDALPIWKIKFANLSKKVVHIHKWTGSTALIIIILHAIFTDRKSTRLNSSHVSISYAVFCLKKKTKQNIITYLIVYIVPISYSFQMIFQS